MVIFTADRAILRLYSYRTSGCTQARRQPLTTSRHGEGHYCEGVVRLELQWKEGIVGQMNGNIYHQSYRDPVL